MKLLLLFVLAATPVWGQTNFAVTNRIGSAASASVEDVEVQKKTNLMVAPDPEKIRNNCIQNRRWICGKILQVLPEGLVVESGYTNLLRDPLMKSWLVPGTVAASLATNLVETTEPGAICVGRVFLINLPKSRGTPKPARYDYVIIEAYPAGQFTYTSLGDIHRTVRRFSASLNKAVDFQIQSAEQNSARAAPVK